MSLGSPPDSLTHKLGPQASLVICLRLFPLPVKWGDWVSDGALSSLGFLEGSSGAAKKVEVWVKCWQGHQSY